MKGNPGYIPYGEAHLRTVVTLSHSGFMLEVVIIPGNILDSSDRKVPVP